MFVPYRRLLETGCNVWASFEKTLPNYKKTSLFRLITANKHSALSENSWWRHRTFCNSNVTMLQLVVLSHDLRNQQDTGGHVTALASRGVGSNLSPCLTAVFGRGKAMHSRSFQSCAVMRAACTHEQRFAMLFDSTAMYS